jgi:hypothetical protein
MSRGRHGGGTGGDTGVSPLAAYQLSIVCLRKLVAWPYVAEQATAGQ